MKTVIIIPARYDSKRFPGKPLAKLTSYRTGLTQPLIQWTWEKALKLRGRVDDIVIATDDTRIRDVAQEFGADVLMTSEGCENGTERCAEAASFLGLAPDDIVINLQGDAPLIPVLYINQLINTIQRGATALATPVVLVSSARMREGLVSAVAGHNSQALYFSRCVIPYGAEVCLAHVGLYGYRVKALRSYTTHSPGLLELAESLEQLRWIENGYQMQCVLVAEASARMPLPPELNIPYDIAYVEEFL